MASFSKTIKWVALGGLALFFSPIALLMVLTALGDVWPMRMKDVPDAPHVGDRCVVLKGLRAHGIYRVGGKPGVTEWVTVTKKPGFSGYEVTFRTDVPEGTAMIITGAQKCWTCPFGSIEYQVSIPSLPQVGRYPTRVYPDALDPSEARCTKQSE